MQRSDSQQAAGVGTRRLLLALSRQRNDEMLRIAVCGHGRHGKKTVSLWLSQKLGLRYKQSTSEAATEVVFNQLKDKYGYQTPQECFDDRMDHRPEWHAIIRKYNEPDGLTLYQEMLDENDIIEGTRDRAELHAIQQHRLVDYTIWVDGSERHPPETSSSCTVLPSDCDVVIDNNGTEEELYQHLEEWLDSIR